MAVQEFTARWRVVPASVAGPSHNKRAITCQDAFETRALPGGGYALAVADGAGGQRYRHSAHGARLAVEAAVEAAASVFGAVPVDLPIWWRDSAAPLYAMACLDGFFQRVDAAIDGRLGGGGRRADLREEYATTLLAAVVYPPFLCYVSVGDGFLVVDREPGGPHLVVPPPASTGAMNETTFLTSPDMRQDLRHFVLWEPAMCGLALCTDGLYEGMLTAPVDRDGCPVPKAPPEFRNYFQFFADGTADAAELTRKLGSREFASTSPDDKTMVLAVLT